VSPYPPFSRLRFIAGLVSKKVVKIDVATTALADDLAKVNLPAGESKVIARQKRLRHSRRAVPAGTRGCNSVVKYFTAKSMNARTRAGNARCPG
jgi:hypothetical protein